LLIVPLLLAHGDPVASASAHPPSGTGRHHAAQHPTGHTPARWKLASSTQSIPATGTTVGTSPPVTSTTVAASAPAPAQAAATAEEVSRQAVVTTTTEPPTTTTTTSAPAAVAPSGSIHYGQVTYYDHPAGTCASPWLPFGTVVEVTNPANGSSVSCVVNDREADTARSIDLATDTFAELAPLSQGVIDAQLQW
jgi:rare lipoprotein A